MTHSSFFNNLTIQLAAVISKLFNAFALFIKIGVKLRPLGLGSSLNTVKMF